MKNFIYKLALITFIVTSCSSGGDDSDGGNQTSDSKPTAPALVFPAQNQLCTTNTLNFEWQASINEDGSSVIYILEIAKDNQFTNKVVDEVLTDLSKIITLEKGLAYYWRVKARSTRSVESDYSPTSQFYTEEVPNSNHLPFAPSLVAPFLGQILENGTSITILEWTGADVDNDPITFDVYFGNDKDALSLVSENTQNNTFDVNLDTADTTYYWKVVVIDDKGASVTGPVWYFKL
ncbi:fibronectin type III domain-containing protein [Hyunsoonleella pacifica]|uniref:Fibronectin type-III domain-containing protein n=1 Tax=Hyunsoonleella pacifica TaxID=1080224 RepID=A0A4Q9FVL5_9FLAO|nr:hypothetical protein [Hyunsoonleella pacifica]TBN18675.1 hypothetical protein EYD46_00995 [Hyunsoonleella pacifica]GGD03734.1 hypothetical protein GCM10011368_01980 [Hyunsoonleella pacifica]